MRGPRPPLTARLLSTLSLCAVLWSAQLHTSGPSCVAAYDPLSEDEIAELREAAKEMFYHGYRGYKDNAWPSDELRPKTCTGFETFGGYSLTLIDALDMLVILDDLEEFEWAVYWLRDHISFNYDLTVSVFETNIRIVGGLLSAHVQAERLLDGYDGCMLALAEDLADRLLPAFDTPSGIPYGSVNLMWGVNEGETMETSTAGGGTFLIEFGVLSALTGRSIFVEVARDASLALFDAREKPIDLVGTHLNITTTKWTEAKSGIGSNIDSFYEYLLKGGLLLGDQELLDAFEILYDSIMLNLKKGPWYDELQLVSHAQANGKLLNNNLQAFWMGLQTLVGDIVDAHKSTLAYHSVWRTYGALPERFLEDGQIPTIAGSKGYHLRPELAESVYYLSRAHPLDNMWLSVGRDILYSLNDNNRVKCGYASLTDVRNHNQEDRMESFFLSETVKYLYLMFDRDNYFNVVPHVFSTEAHPFPFTSAVQQVTAEFRAEYESVTEGLDGPARMCALPPRFKADSLVFYVPKEHLLYRVSDVVLEHPTHTPLPGGEFDDTKPIPGAQPAVNKNAIKLIGYRDDGSWKSFNLAESQISVVPDPSNPDHTILESVNGENVLSYTLVLDRDDDRDGAVITKVIVQPGASVSGSVRAAPALFGPALEPGSPIKGRLALPYDIKGCSGEAKRLAGRIALVERGTCFFSQKAEWAQKQGAIGVIVVNDAQGEAVFTMVNDGGATSKIRIPSVMLGYGDGNKLREVVAAGEEVYVSLEASIVSFVDEDMGEGESEYDSDDESDDESEGETPSDLTIMFHNKPIKNILVKKPKRIRRILAEKARQRAVDAKQRERGREEKSVAPVDAKLEAAKEEARRKKAAKKAAAKEKKKNKKKKKKSKKKIAEPNYQTDL